MRDTELALLQRAYVASGKALKGRAISPSEEQALRDVVQMVEPVLTSVQKAQVRDLIAEISEPPGTAWTPATPTARCLRGRWFR